MVYVLFPYEVMIFVACMLEEEHSFEVVSTHSARFQFSTLLVSR
jgi:hypothetical protein